MKEYKKLLTFFVGLIAISGIGLIDDLIWGVVFGIVGLIAYAVVGVLYKTGIISGIKAGSEANSAIFIIILIAGISLALWLIKVINAFKEWLLSIPNWVWWTTLGVSIALTIGFMVFHIAKTRSKKDKKEAIEKS